MNGIVISGATGTVGRALIEECIRRNIKILILKRENSSRGTDIVENSLIRVKNCSLDQMDKWEPDEDMKYDVFYHLAWMGTTGVERNDMYLQNENIRYTLDAVHLAKRLGCRTFIGAGSQAEYGNTKEKLSESTSVNPQTGYGIAKLCAGQMSREECRKIGLGHIWTRILSVYGPYDGKDTMIVYSIRQLLRGEEPLLTAGEQEWDYLYSADVARAMLLLGQKGMNGKTYCIGSGKTRKLKEYIYLLRDNIDKNLALGIGKKPYGKNQSMYLCADISELTKDTGFIPEVPFEIGIRETIKWVKQQYENKK